MKFFHSFALFITLLILTSLTLHSKLLGCTIRISASPQDQLLDEIASAFSQPTPWEYTLIGSPSLDSWCLSQNILAEFVVCHRGTDDVTKATKLYTELYTHFIRKYNSLHSIRPFLATFPVTPATARLSVRFDEKYKDICHPPKIGLMYLDNEGLVCYTHFTPEKGHPYTKFLTVPAKDIPEIAQLYTQYCPRKTVEPKPTIPLLKSFPRGNIGEKALFPFLKRYVKTIDSELIVIGDIGESYKESAVYAFALINRQLKTLEEAQKIARVCAKDVFDFVRTDKNCIAQIEYQSKTNYPIHPSSIPVSGHIAFSISFWDEDVNRPVQPSIAKILLMNDVFKYYTADEGQKLVLVYQETFDEAMKALE